MKNNHKQFFCGCHDKSSGHLKVLKVLLCGEFKSEEVRMESIHTSLLLYSNQNREQVISCGITHFFSTRILAIENSKGTLPDRKKRFIFLTDLSCSHKSAVIDSFNTELSDEYK